MINILIVEDELLIANLLKNYIEKAGYHCNGIAIDFEQAITILKTKPVDIIFLDITLFGEKSGIDLATHINTNYKIPFIYLTSHSDSSTLKAITATNPIAYLSKPFKEIDVITTLNLHFNNKEFNRNIYKLTIGKSVYNINLEELIYVKSEHVYSTLIFKDETLLVRKSITKLVEILPEKSLVRINKSIAVNPKFIKRINGKTLEFDDISFKISSNYLDDLNF